MMERLTYRNEYGEARFRGNGSPVENVQKIPSLIDRLAAYEDAGLTPEECAEVKKLCDDYVEAGLDAKFVQACIDIASVGISTERIREMTRAEAEGRLIVLPCKVGDTVWVADRGEILKETVFGFNTFKKMMERL